MTEQIKMGQDALSIIIKLNSLLVSNPKLTHLPQNLLASIQAFSAGFEEQRAKEEEIQKQTRAQFDYMNQVRPQIVDRFSLSFSEKATQLFINDSKYIEKILGFLNIQDLLRLRGTNTLFLLTVKKILNEVIKKEEQDMAKVIFSGSLIELHLLKRFLYHQIPEQVRQIMTFDQNECKKIIATLLNKSDFESLRKIKTVKKQHDKLFAPFVLLFSRQRIIQKQNWFQSFKELSPQLSYVKLTSFIKHNLFLETNVLQAADYLNNINEGLHERLSKQSANLIQWCKAVVSLYFLENVFKIRVPDVDDPFVDILTQTVEFFSHQQFLINFCRKVCNENQRFVVYFDFSKIETIKPTTELNLSLFNERNITNTILQFLDNKEKLSYRFVSKSANTQILEFFKHQTEVAVCQLNKENEHMKNLELEHKQKLIKIHHMRGLPQLEKSQIYQMIGGLTRDDISRLKQIQQTTQVYDEVAKVFIVLLDLKVITEKNVKNPNWATLAKFLQQKDAFQQFQQHQPETMPAEKVIQIQDLMSQNQFLDHIKRTNQNLFKLYQWMQGIINLHLRLRKYCISIYDQKLNQEDFELMHVLDIQQLRVYKLARITNQYQQSEKGFKDCYQYLNEFSKTQ